MNQSSRRYSEPCTYESLKSHAESHPVVLTFDMIHHCMGEYKAEKLGFETREEAEGFVRHNDDNEDPLFRITAHTIEEMA